MKLPRVFVLLTVLAALIGTSCTDDQELPTAPQEFKKDPAPSIGALAVDANCLNDLPGAPDSRFNNATCTANDIEIKVLQVTSVDGVPQDPNEPVLCAEGETFQVGLVAFFGINATERYDVGYYFSQDGSSDARTGQCFHGNLEPNFGTPNPTGPLPNGPFVGPYRNLEPEDTGDICGDVPESDEIIFDGQGIAAIVSVPATVSLICTDPDGDGFAEVGTCTSWDNNDRETCEGVDDAVPGTPAKCNCEPALLPIVFKPKLTVTKVLIPDTDDGLFNLKIDATEYATDVGDGGTTGPVALDPGTYTASETAGTDTDLANYDVVIGGDCATDGTVTLVAGDDKTCTITNTRKPTIIIEKTVVGNGATFDFTGAITATLGNGETAQEIVSPGQHTVTETTVDGYSLTDISCDDDDSTGDTGTATATFNVAAGEVVKCTFTNTRQGVITVKKITDPADDPQQFNFTGNVAGTIGHNGELSTEDLDPGQYTSTETVPEGWDLTAISCSDDNSTGDTGTGVATFNLEAGESVTCTFTNTKRGSITIEKQTLPDGDAQSFTFAGDVSGSLTDGQTATQSVAPGTYTSVETVPTGWALTNLTCDDADSTGDTGTATATFNVDAGEDVKCTFTNTKLGSITVEKQTDPAGDPQSFTFTGDAAGSIADDGTIVVGDLLPNTYTSTETVPAMWALTDIQCDDANSTGDTGTATATFILEAGEDVKCTFTNTKGGMIKVVKQTIPNGAPGDFTFAGDLVGTIQDDGFIEKGVVPGQYTTTETVPTGFDLTDIQCDDADSTGDTGTATATYNVAAGETVTCTFTNTAKGTIIVEKQTVPDGDLTSFTFTGDAAGSIADGGQIMVTDLSPGTYTSTETVPAGWELTDITCDDANSTGDTGTATATFNVEAGETVKCIFTNTGKGTIIVEKQTIPDGDLTSFTFAGDVAGSIADGGQLTSADVLAGQYTSTETVPAGWDLKSIQCDDANSTGDTGTATATFNLEPGETVTCTFTNEALAKISLQKLVDGVPSTISWNFTLDGPGVSEGVTFTSSTTFNDAFLMLGSTYRICEVGLPASWMANWTLDGAPVTPTPDPIDNSILCYDFTPTSPDDAGGTFQFVVDNRTPPGGEPRTIGYWKNWNRCSGGGQAANADRNGGAAEGFWLLEDVLPLFLGSYEVTSCENGVTILDKRSLDGRKRANDGAYDLAAQLLAAKANISPVVNAGCRPPALNTWIADADALLTSLGFNGSGSYLPPGTPDRDQALMLAGYLDDYNNGMYCGP